MNVNLVTLAGRLTRDPEMIHTTSGMEIAKFGLAINNNRSKKKETTFVDIVCFDKTAHVVGQYIKKGDPLYIQGRLQLETWQAKDGGKRSKISVVADRVEFINSKPHDDDSGAAVASMDSEGPQVAAIPAPF